MARLLEGSWIEHYINYTRYVESPRSFHVWVAISTVASALQRKVWISFKGKHVTIYPNLFIVLTAPPGVCRKGTIINVGLELLRRLEGPYIIANDITREKLLREMNENAFTDMAALGPGKVYTHSSVTCVAEEFITLLGVNNIELLGTLTALWNCDNEYTYSTKGAGEDKIINPYCNILAGTTPQWLSSSLPIEAIGGGFTSRILFVVEYDNERTISLTDKTATFDSALEKALVHDLGSIYRECVGEMQITDQAGEWYTDWYTRYKAAPPTISDERFDSYFSRKQVMLWKVAMCLSAAESNNNMLVDVRHLEGSIALLNALEDNMPKAFGGLGRSDTYELMEKIKTYLITSKRGLTSKQLMSLMWHQLEDVSQLHKMLGNWRTMEKVVTVDDPKTGHTLFKWVDMPDESIPDDIENDPDRLSTTLNQKERKGDD